MNDKIITKGIIGFGFNSFKSEGAAIDNALNKFKNDSNASSECRSVLINRFFDTQSHIDFLKFNLPFPPIWYEDSPGVPMAHYVMFNNSGGGLEEIAIVGSDEVHANYDLIKDLPAIKKSIQHLVTEGEIIKKGNKEIIEEGLGSTIREGQKPLKLSDSELTMFCAGDIPFFYSLQPILNHKLNSVSDLVVALNAREALFPGSSGPFNPEIELFPRNYYRKICDWDGKTYHTKEPNAYAVNMNKIDDKIYDILYGHRKGGGVGLNAALKIARIGGDPYKLFSLFEFILLESYNLVVNGQVSHKNVERLASKLTYKGSEIKANFVVHDDWTRCLDIDSWQDWLRYSEFFQFMSRKYSKEPLKGLDKVYPYAEEIKTTEDRMRTVKSNNNYSPIYKNAPAVINECFHKHGLEKPYDSNGKFISNTIPTEQHERMESSLQKLLSEYNSTSSLSSQQKNPQYHCPEAKAVNI